MRKCGAFLKINMGVSIIFFKALKCQNLSDRFGSYLIPLLTTPAKQICQLNLIYSRWYDPYGPAEIAQRRKDLEGQSKIISQTKNILINFLGKLRNLNFVSCIKYRITRDKPSQILILPLSFYFSMRKFTHHSMQWKTEFK